MHEQKIKSTLILLPDHIKTYTYAQNYSCISYNLLYDEVNKNTSGSFINTSSRKKLEDMIHWIYYAFGIYTVTSDIAFRICL